MIAVVGLGNPGDEYAKTRHNAGFLAIDCLAYEFNANYWKEECGALVAHCKNFDLFDEEVLLVKPQSFMNLSGSPVKNILDKYNLSFENLIIIHDDMDIDNSKIRVKCGGSSAGHNGLKSITNKLSTDKYIRIRIGIGKAPGRMPHADYVLNEPKSKDLDMFNQACHDAAEATIYYLNYGLEKTQQRYNRKCSI